ncbi:hypothetical protein CC80DRAFT_551017 [Byssothecium circinans]|uniref:Uncharacterized protein n=1 Tax=Byssothecium circinans TaxID=147558 RepID=A0A6A5TM02_9PLEO|nr:hypothetical protein CC80DRAFT_551017 [Byssothecium circinans]
MPPKKKSQKRSAPKTESTNTTKKTKREEPQHPEDTPKAQSQSDEEWQQSWTTTYHFTLLKEVSEVRKRESAAPEHDIGAAGSAVYVAVHHTHGKWVDPYIGIIGTYTTASAANEHAMIYFAKDYDLTKEGDIGLPEYRMRKGDDRDLGYYRDVDRLGCVKLSLVEEDGTQDVFVERHTLREQAPVRKFKSVREKEDSRESKGWWRTAF